MQIIGIYDKTLYRDEFSGNTIFSLIPKNSNIPLTKFGTAVFKGYIQHIPPGTSLKIECSKEIGKNNQEYYKIESYDFAIDGEKELEQFLKSVHFTGIGPVKIKTISEKFPNLFSLIQKEDCIEIIQGFGVSYDNAVQMIQTIKEMYSIRNVFTALFKYNISYEKVLRVYAYLNGKDINYIFLNPFVLLKFDIPYHICEKIAADNGITQYHPARLQALIQSAYQCFNNYGHTKVTFSMLSKKCYELEQYSGIGYVTSPFFLIGYITQAGLKIVNEDNKFFIYNEELFNKELRIAKEIRRIGNIVNNNKKTITYNQIAKIEKEQGIVYSPKQKEAFTLIETPGVKILTGGPGTGKTTVINGLIKAYRLLFPDKKVSLCAPTGCAAKQMTNATGIQAYTIHKLLDIKVFNGTFVQAINKNNKLNADFIIVDESSMIDTELMHMLVQSVKNNAILLFVGDENQLPSVGYGNILHDLLGSTKIQSCRLNQVFRQKDTSLIIENSVNIKNQAYKKIKQGEDFKIIQKSSEEELKNTALSLIKKLYNKEKPFSVRLFSPVKNFKYDLSTITLNNIMHDYYVADKDVVVFGARKFSKGDPVIFTVNNYEMGYYNGDTGIVTAIISEKNRKTIEVTTDDNVYYLGMTNWKDIDLAYAITTHKSQGSECETAIIILPEKPENMLTNSLVYVAATRAKKNNIILVQNDALKKAVENKNDIKRLTGLKERLTEVYAA